MSQTYLVVSKISSRYSWWTFDFEDFEIIFKWNNKSIAFYVKYYFSSVIFLLPFIFTSLHSLHFTSFHFYFPSFPSFYFPSFLFPFIFTSLFTSIFLLHFIAFFSFLQRFLFLLLFNVFLFTFIQLFHCFSLLTSRHFPITFVSVFWKFIFAAKDDKDISQLIFVDKYSEWSFADHRKILHLSKQTKRRGQGQGQKTVLKMPVFWNINN